MQSKTSDGRGHPPGSGHSSRDKNLFDYLIRISEKHGVNHDRLLKKMVEARDNEKSVCKNLMIQCLGKPKNYAVFRITRKNNIVAQFRIPNYLLEEEDDLKIKPANSV